MIYKLVLLLLFYNFGWAQNYQTTNVVADAETKLPLEYVNVFNRIDNTVSNSDGSFIFKSKEKQINLSAIGYQPILTSFDQINNLDTIFLKSNTIELDELVISNTASVLDDVYRNLNINYPSNSFNERFFLRCIVRKNNEVTRLQDVFGKIERNSLFRNQEIKKVSYNTEILNMRKVDLTEKSAVEYLSFYSLDLLYGWYSSIFLKSIDYNFRNIPVNDEAFLKIEFSPIDSYNGEYPRNGYYLINKDDKAIKEVRYSMIMSEDEPYKSKRNMKWKTIETSLVVNFRKNMDNSKYYISNAKLYTTTEVINETTDKKDFYEIEYNLLTTESFIKDKVNSNFSVEKDLFKANFSYSEDFWKNQNQLLLTTELKEFLSRVSENKSKGSEYKIIGNF